MSTDPRVWMTVLYLCLRSADFDLPVYYASRIDGLLLPRLSA